MAGDKVTDAVLDPPRIMLTGSITSISPSVSPSVKMEHFSRRASELSCDFQGAIFKTV